MLARTDTLYPSTGKMNFRDGIRGNFDLKMKFIDTLSPFHPNESLRRRDDAFGEIQSGNERFDTNFPKAGSGGTNAEYSRRHLEERSGSPGMAEIAHSPHFPKRLRLLYYFPTRHLLTRMAFK